MLITGGRLVDPAHGIDALRDVRIAGGIVVEIGEHLVARHDEEVIDARGAYVAPGFIDMHVHLREPGYPQKETIVTGTQAAASGGFTTIACMPNTNPALDSAEVLDDLQERIVRDALVHVVPIGAITRGREGETPVDFRALVQHGAVAFSDDGNTVMNARVLRDAALAARDLPGVFISHAEDENVKGDAVMHEGVVSRDLGVRGSPSVAEDIIVARDLLIAADTQKRWHIAHLSTRGALQALAFGRSRGARASAEVTPHHVLLTDETVRERGAEGKVNPPLRTQDDVRALRDAVRDGTIDVFATDHAPHTASEKSGDLSAAAVGFSGLEVAVGAYAEALPDLSITRFVELLSTNPARVLGVKGGSVEIGARGDITIFADEPWIVDPSAFVSKGKATPFSGRRLPRRAIATIVGGTLITSSRRRT